VFIGDGHGVVKLGLDSESSDPNDLAQLVHHAHHSSAW
jgi:hypothetical protein